MDWVNLKNVGPPFFPNLRYVSLYMYQNVINTQKLKQNGMVEDFTLFQARKQQFLKRRKVGVYLHPLSLSTLSLVSLSRGSNNLHSIFRLRALRYWLIAADWIIAEVGMVMFPFSRISNSNLVTGSSASLSQTSCKLLTQKFSNQNIKCWLRSI